MKGNFEKAELVNPSVPTKPRPIYASLYVNKHGRLVLFRKRVKIVRTGFGHHRWNYRGTNLCPVHKQGRQWVISTEQ